jgi:hypothetical protein
MLKDELVSRETGKVLTIECYTGVHEDEIAEAVARHLKPDLIVHSSEAYHTPERLESLVAPFTGGDDPLFGTMTSLRMPDYLDPLKVDAVREKIRSNKGLSVLIGAGASLIERGDCLVHADLSRWEAQMRMRRGEVSSLGAEDSDSSASLLYKRAYFNDWRVCDRHKRELMGSYDFLLDTHLPGEPKMVAREWIVKGYEQALSRPFRLVPLFDPAPWGGQWMKEAFGLPPEQVNYGWCFDCLPEENSLLLRFGDLMVELPALNLVFHDPALLLGEQIHARFGAEFPIRFGFLDTTGAGNLSLQVHPQKDFIEAHFGVPYTQDESYYILDAGEGAKVFLGLKDGTDPAEFFSELEAAQQGGGPFDDGKFSLQWPAKRHDHFLIPAGLCHSAGAEMMVLEVSATPYIFTFKLWDWGRPGLNGRPRPLNVERGKENIAWHWTERMVKEQLVNAVEPLASGDGWREERTGLHETQFIETRRHWFTGEVLHETGGRFHVINLVSGAEVILESPDGSFASFVLHFAETCIIPASVGAYTVRPHGRAAGTTCATLKAYVRD